METQHLTRSKWRAVLTVATFVALIIVVYGLRKQILDVVKELGRVNAVALLLIIPFELLNYDSYARYLVSIYKTLGKHVRYWPMFRLTLELNFVNHLLPSGGISGITFFNLRVRKYGISGPASTVSQVLKLFLLYTSFQPLLVLGVLLLALRGHVNNIVMVVASSMITLLIVGTLLAIYVIEDRQRINATLTTITKSLNWVINLFRRSHPETFNIEKAQKAFNELHDNYELIKGRWRELKKPFFYMMLANATEVAAVYAVYIAFGHLVNVGAVILAYAVANFAGLISVLPAGIGVYEGLMTAVLAATGIPVELSIPVTIMYRVINMFIQLTPGYILYQRALRSGITPSTS